MNYRHAYHAGNFADVVKHAVLALVLEHMKRKETPFRVVDTHAGTGLYDLAGEEAQKTGEWQHGIGRILAAAPPGEIAAILAPYLDAVRAENDGGPLVRSRTSVSCAPSSATRRRSPFRSCSPPSF